MTPRAWASVAAAVVALGAAAPAAAQVRVEVVPVFGAGCMPGTEPTELIVGLTNPGAARVAGVMRVEPPNPSRGAGVRTVQAVPFAVPPRASVNVRMPLPVGWMPGGEEVLRVEDTSSGFTTQQPLSFHDFARSMVVDATPQSRMAFAIRSAATPDPTAIGLPSPLTTAVAGLTGCPAMRVPQTGEVVLPRSRVGYNGVALLVVDAATVMSLPDSERAALGDFLLTGGSMVLIPSRPDELRHPTLAALVGTGVVGITPQPLDPTTVTWITSVPGTAAGTFPLEPTLRGAQSYQGGNLHTRALGPLFPWGAPDLLGATAEYGIGHVHVLSFNPTMPPGVEDPWSVALIAQLAHQAEGGRSTRLLADSPVNAGVPAAVRRALDPNEGFRPGLGLAVVLLALYAILAGPVAFRYFARRGRPTRGLSLLPAWAGLLFAGIVAMGVVTRGWQGHARRFAYVDVPAGFSRGPMRRYHGYYSGNSGGIEIRTRGHDRRLYADPFQGTGYVTLNLEREAASLRGLATTAWTTAVVREEGFETLPGSITIQPDPVGQLRIVNRTPYPFRSVVVLSPGGTQGWAIREIAPRASVLATQGIVLSPGHLALFTGNSGVPIPRRGYALPAGGDAGEGWSIATLFNGGPDVAARWSAALAIGGEAGGIASVEPVVAGQLMLPVPDVADGGLRVDQSVVFVRVVGYGGAL